jgi:hypothetical protein
MALPVRLDVTGVSAVSLPTLDAIPENAVPQRVPNSGALRLITYYCVQAISLDLWPHDDICYISTTSL